ncbi:MAG: DUF456 domain-containing protein [Burkholderiaceae bacterium]|nr:MAG: DUF456 domain-containing protein [Burkholderiaceae bacterium]
MGQFSVGTILSSGSNFSRRQHHGRAAKVGVATWLGLLAGMLAKVVLAFMMIGIYIVALMV